MEQQTKTPSFNSKEMKCIACGETMFYSKDNLVHVCLKSSHGILAYFEPDSCWFAAEESTAIDLSKKGIKYHFIPKSVFENGGIGPDFECEYSDKQKKQ
ncbi:MAG: hypothetical protein ACREBS_09115 [Nitrososphaerales archaeon]